MTKYHFISGLPRSGSTLLTSILNQNPRFHSTISNPLARFVRSVITESHAGPGYALQCDENKRIELIQSLVSTYHSHFNKEVCFNTNRGWSSLLPVINKTHPDSRIILCVRDINWVLDSFERLFRSNPFAVSKMYNEQEASTVYTRCNALMSPGHTVRFAYDCIKEVITSELKYKIFLVEYEQLAKRPEATMRGLYNFIAEPYFKHNFNDVEASYDEYDYEAGISGLHTIRKKVEFKERKFILPPDVLHQFENLEVWR